MGSVTIFRQTNEIVTTNYKIESLIYQYETPFVLSVVLCLTIVLCKPIGFKTTYYLYIHVPFPFIYTIFISSTTQYLLCILYFLFPCNSFEILLMMMIVSSLQLQLKLFQNTYREGNVYEFLLFSMLLLILLFIMLRSKKLNLKH